jgi:hypothetical protein
MLSKKMSINDLKRKSTDCLENYSKKMVNNQKNNFTNNSTDLSNDENLDINKICLNEISNNKHVETCLSLINPDTIEDLGISVDSDYRFQQEENFNPDKIAWKFYGSPREFIVYSDGQVEYKYGLNHSFGYIVSVLDCYIIYDVLYGLIIERVYSDYDYTDEIDDSFSD